MNAQAMEPDLVGHVWAIRGKIGGPDISELSRDLYFMAGHSRSALFAAKALATDSCTRDVDVHVLNLIEIAHDALVGRFEEVSEGIETYSGRLNVQIEQLLREQLALRKTVRALVSMLDSSDLETVGEAATLLYDDWIRSKTAAQDHVFWTAFMAKLKNRGLSIGFEESPDAPGVARPMVFTETSKKLAKKREALTDKYVKDLIRVEVAGLDEGAENAPTDRSTKTAEKARSAVKGAG
ncbi:MAG TPA: hypothetical protein PLR02_10145 [Rhodocyclaceae bacterium]|nr:hypothetical protein [Rhodocyclaceae bacterium]